MRPSPRPLPALLAALAVAAGGALAPAPAGASPDRTDVAQAPGATGAGLRLSLRDALDLAVRRGPDLARAGLAVDIARGDADATGARPWQLAVTAGRTRTTSDADAATAITTDRDRLDASLGHRFAIGTTVAAAATTAGAVDGRAPVSRDDLAFSSLSLSLIQPLLAGARPGAVDGQRRAAASAARAADARLDATRADVVAAVTAAYWELAFAHADVGLRRRSLDAGRRQVRLTDSLVRGGQVPRSAVIAAERAVAERADTLVSAELAIVERSLVLHRLLGLAATAATTIVATDPVPDSVASADLDAAALADRAVRTSPVVIAAAAELDASRSRRRAATDARLPSLDAELATSTTFVDSSDAGATAVGATTDLVVTAGLTLRHDLGGSGAGLARRERAAERRARLELDEARRGLRLDLAAATARVDAATRRLSLTRTIADQASVLASAEVTRFTAGQATVFDVVARQAELEDAERRALRAAVDRAVACADLCRLAGSCPDDAP